MALCGRPAVSAVAGALLSSSPMMAAAAARTVAALARRISADRCLELVALLGPTRSLVNIPGPAHWGWSWALPAPPIL